MSTRAARRILIGDCVRVVDGEHAGKCGLVMDKVRAEAFGRTTAFCVRFDGEPKFSAQSNHLHQVLNYAKIAPDLVELEEE